MQKFPIFGMGVESISPDITAQKRVNCFYEVVQEGEKEKVAIRGTPGLTTYCILPTFPIRGMAQAGGFLYVVAGAVVYQISPGGGYFKITTIVTASDAPVSMAINETQLIIVDGSIATVIPYTLGVSPNSATEVQTLIGDIQPLTFITQQLGFA